MTSAKQRRQEKRLVNWRGGRLWPHGLLAGAVALTLGCEDKPTLPPTAAAPSALPAVMIQQPAPQVASETPPAATSAEQAPKTVTIPSDNGDPTPGADREKANRGSGVKGQKYGGGVYTEPVRQYFRLLNASTFEIQIPHALDLFKAANNRYPKDWDEFKKEILDPASITLPDLYPGERYVFDSKAGELMVERPIPATPEQK